MPSQKTNKVRYMRMIVESNFYFSLVILIFGSAVSLSDSYTLFEFNADLYGELANNLRIMMVYIAFTETLVFGFCFVTKQYQYFILVGLFLMAMSPAMAFYTQVNNVEIDPDLDVFFLYTGISQLLLGAMTTLKT